MTGREPAAVAARMKPVTDSVSRAQAMSPAFSLGLAQVRDLMRELIARDLKLRYRGSVLGLAWTLLNPIAELLVLLFVFGRLLPFNIENYASFLFIGLLVYGWFQTALLSATGAIVANKELIQRPGVPAAILPVVTVASALLHFLFGLPVLLALLLASGVPMTPALAGVPVLIAIEFVFILCLSYPVAALHVWFRDTQHVLRIALQLLFYLTPVFYDISTIPERFRGFYRWNPMAILVEAYRDVLMRGRLPSALPLLGLTVVSLVLLAIGLSIFRRTSHQFADEL